jgi:hypothetical protein
LSCDPRRWPPAQLARGFNRDRNEHNPRAAYEVELVKPDGSSVDVVLDANYKVIHIDRDHHADSQDRED